MNFRSIPNNGNVKIKAITKPFDRLLSRWMKLWFNEITNCNVKTSIRRKL